VYLDSDVIVEKDLEPLYHSDLGDKAVGAVRSFRQRNGRGPVDFSRVPYFNAGVLVVSRREWIACQFSERALDCMASHPEGLQKADQDALNFALNGDWTSLDSRWNQQSSVWEISYRSLGISQDAMKSLRNDPFIIHFSGHRKPWHFGDDHPLGRRFFHYGRLAKISLPNPKPENAVELLRRATKFVTPRRCRPVVRGALVNAKGFGKRLGLAW
jgi:UDP-glucose/galactose:(glucosyl)LPS alpha-1,2-glucosyl/galactosyltransferase